MQKKIEAYVDPYNVLGLEPTATSAEIKRAYFALVREYPPESQPEAFKRIRAAYEKLRDPQKRLETDMLLLNKVPKPNPRRRLPKLDVSLTREDMLFVARSLSDLERKDWRDQFKKINL